MVIYEVTASVEDEVCVEYERFMRKTHIPDLLRTGLFESAVIERSSAGTYPVRYAAETPEALDRYLKEHAARLRADFVDHFPSGVELSREEWDVLETFA